MSQISPPVSPGGSVQDDSPRNSYNESSDANMLGSVDTGIIQDYTSQFGSNFEKYAEPNVVSRRQPTWKPAGDVTSSSNSKVPRLCDLIIKKFAENYHFYPAIDQLPAEYIPTVISLIDPRKIDFPTAARFITCERFWERLCIERWPLLDVHEHGNSYKRLFCERHVASLIESYFPAKDTHNYQRLLAETEAAKPFVHCLKLQLMSDLDLAEILSSFPLLHSLQVRYGAARMGMDYDKALFGMQLAYALSLSRLITSAKLLTHLTLSENLLTDEMLHIFVRGLADNCTLTHIDLSNNKLTSVGARRLAKLIETHSVLCHINLANNNIDDEGAFAIADAITDRFVTHIDLSLNPIGDVGGCAMLEASMHHNSLTSLNLSACGLAHESSQALVALLNSNQVLQSLDVSSNDVMSAGQGIVDALRKSTNISALKSLDLRKNRGDEQVMSSVKELIMVRKAKAKQTMRKAYRSGWDELV